MDELFIKVQGLIKAGDVLISEHGYDELIEDNLSVRELLDGVINGAVVERYTDYPKGPCLLLLQQDKFAILFMLYGAFRKNLANPLFWLRLTGQIQSAGMKIFYGGEKNEISEKN